MTANSIVKVNSLKWVKKDLLMLLDEAKNLLQNHLESGDVEVLPQMLNILRQISGTLTMVEVQGGVQLCDECLDTTTQLIEQKINNVSEAQEALLRALMQMGGYIDQVSTLQKDQPAIVLPVINDLRTVCGKELVTDFDMSLRSIHAIEPELADVSLNSTQVNELAKKLRPQFQLGLLAWLKNSEDYDALKKMQSVVSQLRASAKEDAASRLWWVSDGLLQALQQDGIEVGTAIKSLLGKVDRQIKQLSDSSEAEFAEQMPAELIRNVLYYLSRAKSDTPVIQNVKQKLREAGYEYAEEQSVQTGPSDELLRTVSVSVKDDLNQAKDILDISGAKSDVEALSALPPLLTKIADTLGMLGLTDTRLNVRSAATEFATQLEAIDFSSSSLPAVADALLLADNSLEKYLTTRSADIAQNTQKSGTEDALLNKVIDESAKDLDQVREAILAHFADTAEDGQIESSVDVVGRISGAMFVEELQPVQPLIDGLKTFIEDRLVKQALQLTDSQQDVLADLIAAIEYYFTSIQEHKGDTEPYMTVGQAALTALMAIPSNHASNNEVEDEAHDELLSDTKLESEKITQFEQVAGDSHQERDENQVVKPNFVLPVLLSESDLPYEQDLAIISDDTDSEILDIFIEECLEEHERISELFPQWSDNPENQELCTTIRRSFHTLKGSGRLVGADLIGEYGWAMENMMNRLLEGQIERSPAMMSSIEDTIGLLPQMIEQLTGNKQPIKAAYDNMALAWSLAEGQPWQDGVVLTEPDVVEDITDAELLLTSDESGSAIIDDIVLDETDSYDEPVDTDFDPDQALSDLDNIATLLDAEVNVQPDPEIDFESHIDTKIDVSLDEAEAIFQREMQEELEQEIRFFEGTQEADQAEELERAMQLSDEAHIDNPPLEMLASEALTPDNTTERIENQQGTVEAETPAIPVDRQYDLPEMDDVLADIYTKESVTHILTIESQLAEAKKTSQAISTNDELTRALHTLHGSSRIAQMHALADVAKQLELYGNAQLELGEIWSGESVNLLGEAATQFTQVLKCLSDSQEAKPDLVGLLHQVEPITKESQARVDSKSDGIDEASDDSVISVDNEDELVLMFIEECEELIDECDETLQTCEQEGFSDHSIKELQRQMHTLKGGARMAELMPMGDLSHAIEEVVIDVQDNKIEGSEHVISGLRTACDQLSAMLTEVSQKGQLSSSNKTMVLLEQLRSPDYVPTKPEPVVAVDDKPSANDDEVTSTAIATTEIEYSANIKDELTIIFVDEAEGLINQCDNLITGWEQDGYKGDKAEDIQRQLHTLKGGARMAALEPIGDLSQALEDAVNRVESGAIEADSSFVSLMNASTDKLSDMVSDIKSKGHFSTANGLVEKLNALIGAEGEAPSENTQSAEDTAQKRFKDVEAAPKAMTSGTTEQVRVQASKLDQLVNNAGEVSIFHSRLSQTLNNFNFNLEELDQAVDRVQQQVRQISIETDAQIDSRIEQEAERDENFDPLEMDRYTQMQQLTRSLLETVSDLEDLRGTFGGLVKDSETILVQQQRVSSTLQDGLMSTRMVNFEGLTSRFRRLARQTANTLNKKVEIYFDGVENEVDRSIQENMVSPLEHMIRNAISHGIESSEVRAKTGKSEKGVINLSIGRDGSYIVIKLEDDGAGIDPDVVRAKAIERGLIEKTDIISDEEVIQFILHSGFSTAKQVTQVAGRGVGMDVVSNEVKELGGTLNIQSSIGYGTTFIVRLPLTLAINQALMVAIEEQPYAVQLNAIEGVARVTSEDLQKQYSSQKPLLKYGDQIYRVRYLPKMMGIDTPPDLKAGDQNSLLLVHLGDKRYAIHVDEILGRREVVVKPVGRQLSSMPGISGATILDDGKVAIILELGGLLDNMDTQIAPVIRTSDAPATQPAHEVEEKQIPEVPVAKPAVSEKPTVMVVDDSITIRKVSTRFLERNHYKVVTAKDGMDAVAQLQDIKPDLMLLDIEMPRMDGYGVATHVRNSIELKDLPIIMITSRTAQKHKDRAMDIGVNRYLGKPFQEDQLLENIEALLNGDEA